MSHDVKLFSLPYVYNASPSVPWSILHLETCVIPLWKAIIKGFIPFIDLWAIYGGRYDSKTENKLDCQLVTVLFIHIQSNAIPLLKALIEIFISSLHCQTLSNLWGYYNQKHDNVWFNRVMCSLTDLLIIIISSLYCHFWNFLGIFESSRGSHWAAPEPMCLPTMRFSRISVTGLSRISDIFQTTS